LSLRGGGLKVAVAGALGVMSVKAVVFGESEGHIGMREAIY
jgi:hypothetical protein